MRKIILTSLFFCLSITTILAQVVTTNIATPNSSGLSDNQVVSFDVNSDGTILNNSASDGTAQLGGTAVTANSNITADSEADLILLQVTGTGGSDLGGIIEVFGNKAGIIIANPNGITCDGCGFINADRVDLVTGTYNIATETYSISDNDITVDGGGLLANTVGVLNIQTNNFTNTSELGVSADTFNLSVAGDFINNNASRIIVANTFNLSVAGDFVTNSGSGIEVNTFNLSLAGDFINNNYSRIIVANTFNLSVAGDFVTNSGSGIESNTFNLSVAGDFDKIVNYRADDDRFITNNDGFIDVNALNLNVGGDFTFSNSANNLTLRANDILTVSGNANITAADFNNSGTIDVDNSFNAMVDNFINESGATIIAPGGCNIVYTTSYTDNGTSNCLNSVDDTIVIDIVEPNSNGLSNNQVDDFDVNSYGTILNNSAGGGTAQLGVIVTSNSNITAGSEASLILLQVTGSTGSNLDGAIEVFGTSAGIIIANPNGIDCNGCGFINTNRVDLVTGTYDLNTNTYATIDAADITVTGDALDLSNVDILNIQTGLDFINSATIDAGNLNITVGADFINSATIDAGNLNITATGDGFNNTGVIIADTVTIKVTSFVNNIGNAGTVSSDILNFILTDSFTHNGTSFNAFNFNNLGVSTDGTFTNSTTFAVDNLTIKTGESFENNSVLNTTSFTATVGGTFSNNLYSTINADSFTATVGENFFNNIMATINANSFTLTTNNFHNITATINADSFTLTTNKFSNNSSSTINADTITIEVPNFKNDISNSAIATISSDSLNIILTDDFTHDSVSFYSFNFSNLTISTDGAFTNTATLSLDGNLEITANTFTNTGEAVSSDTFALSVAGDFDYSSDFLSNGTITTNALNLNVGGDFSNNDASSDFTWATNDTLTVLGSAYIVTASFDNRGTITVANNSLNVTTDTFINTGSATANIFNLNVVGDFDYSSDYLNNGTINENILNLIVGGNFIYDDSSSDFTWDAQNSLIVLGNADITTDNYIQAGAIDVSGDWIVNANNFTYNSPSIDFIWDTNDILVVLGTVDITTKNFVNGGTISADTFAISVAGDFDYSSDFLNNGTNTADNLNFTARNGAFINDTTLDLAGNLRIAGNDFINIGAISITADSLTISLTNNFTNRGTIDVADSFEITAGYTAINRGSIVTTNLDLTANDFINIGASSVTANSFTISLTNNFTNRGSIYVADSFEITAGYTAINRGSIVTTNLDLTANDFINIGAISITADSFTISLTNNFTNSGTINVADSFGITAGYTAINQSSIVSGSLVIIANDFFRNLTGGDISVDTLNIIAGGKVTNTATIDVAGTLSIIANDDSSRTNDTTGFYVSNRGNITAIDFNIAAVDNFYNRGNITATNFTTSAKDIFFLNKEIDSFVGTYDGGNISLTGDSSFIAADGIIENYGNIDLGVFNLDISADSFTNKSGANVTAATVDITSVTTFINGGSITATINQ